MYNDDQDDDVKPARPPRIEKKGSNPPEIAEVAPWRLTRRNEERDRHHHVV